MNCILFVQIRGARFMWAPGLDLDVGGSPGQDPNMATAWEHQD